MNQEKIVLASKVMELSETQTHLDLVDRVCFYDAPNLNGVQLPSEGALEKAETLVNMPVVAFYKQDADGLPDLGGHECYADPVTGEVKFGTENIGTHTAVEIKDDVVEVNGVQKTLPCLFTSYRIWTRNKNVTAAVKRLFSEGKLGNSWEILSTAFTFENGIKTLNDYVFEGRALLGSGVTPAYGSNACSLSMASANECELMIAEALAADMHEKEENMEKDEKIPQTAEVNEPEVDTPVTEPETAEENPVVEEPVVTETAEDAEPAAEPETAEENPQPEVAMLTDWDIREKLESAYKNTYGKWAWANWLFPADGIAWMRDDDCKGDTDMIQVNFTVNGDELTITDAKPAKLAVSVASINDVVAEKDEALVQANARINELSDEIASLRPYKEAADAAEQARIEAETAEKRKAFQASMMKTKLFQEEEFETSEKLKNIVEAMDETAMKAEIAERFMKSISENPEPEKAPESVKASVEVAEQKKTIMDDGGEADSETFMRYFFSC